MGLESVDKKEKTLEPVYDSLSQRLMYRDSDSNKLLTRADVHELLQDDIAEAAARAAIVYAHEEDISKVVLVTSNDLIVEKYDAEKYNKLVDTEDVLLLDELSGEELDDDELFAMIRSDVENELDPKIQFKKRVKTLDIITNDTKKMYEVYDLKHKTVAFVDESNDIMSWNDVSKMYNHSISLDKTVKSRGSLVIAEGGFSKSVVRFDAQDDHIRAQRFEGKSGYSYKYGKGKDIKQKELNEIIDKNKESDHVELSSLEKIMSYRPKGLDASNNKIKPVSLADLSQNTVYGLYSPNPKRLVIKDDNENDTSLEY